MKILHIVHIDHLGNGIAVVVNELSNAQRFLNNEVKVMNVRINSIDIDNFIKCGNQKDYIEIIDSFKPEIAVIHGVFYKEIRTLSSILVKRQIPYIIVPHGAYSEDNYKKNKYKKWIFKKLYLDPVVKYSRGFIFLNETEKNKFSLTYKKPTHIIPNGCSKHTISQIINTPNKKIHFLYLGRIALHHKGLDLLIEAIKLLEKEKYNNIKFDFYGPGKSKDIERFKHMISPLSTLITYHGPIYGKEKEIVIEKSDIFILTSRFEGFPMSILEALSFGKPCLVSIGTNTTNIISKYKCGWILPALTTQDIAKTIKLSAKEYSLKYNEYRENAITASEEYYWDRIAEHSINIYKDIIHFEQCI